MFSDLQHFMTRERSQEAFFEPLSNPRALHPFGPSEKSEPVHYGMVVPALPTQKQACT